MPRCSLTQHLISVWGPDSDIGEGKAASEGTGHTSRGADSPG